MKIAGIIFLSIGGISLISAIIAAINDGNSTFYGLSFIIVGAFFMNRHLMQAK